MRAGRLQNHRRAGRGQPPAVGNFREPAARAGAARGAGARRHQRAGRARARDGAHRHPRGGRPVVGARAHQPAARQILRHGTGAAGEVAENFRRGFARPDFARAGSFPER